MPVLSPDAKATPAVAVTVGAERMATPRRATRGGRRRWWLALGVAWLGSCSAPAWAAPDAVAVLPPPQLLAELSTPLTQAVRQALSAAHVTLIGTAETETALSTDAALRTCTTSACLERVGRLLNASAVVRFSATAQSPGSRATYQLQVDYFQVAVGAQSASLTSTCASCSAADAAQSLRELTRQVLAADAARPRGELAIVSTPPDATVVVDGNDAGHTPYQRPALVGTHAIVLSAAGYLSQQVSLSVAEARTSRLDVHLVASSAAVATTESAAKPLYKKPWFWLAVGGAAVAVAAVTTGVVLSQSRAPTEPTHAPNHIVF